MEVDSVNTIHKQPNESAAPHQLLAYRLPGYPNYPEIVTAPGDREWMDVGTRGWANRCLPLRIANQAGWFILNDVDVEIIWGGKRSNDNLKILYRNGEGCRMVKSMFGYGIVTWSIPYLFRTAPGFNLLVRGPVNMPRDGFVPLEGVVETDWLPFPFTMNWQVTRRLKSIRIARGQPICMIAPTRRGEIESFQPEIRNLESNPELHRSFDTWYANRRAKVEEMAERQPEATHPRVQGHYIRGEGHLGEKPIHGHQTKLQLNSFVVSDPARGASEQCPAAAPPSRKGFLSRLLKGSDSR